jgi:hypothetical protein
MKRQKTEVRSQKANDGVRDSDFCLLTSVFCFYLFRRPITSPAKMVINAANVDSVPTIR